SDLCGGVEAPTAFLRNRPRQSAEAYPNAHASLDQRDTGKLIANLQIFHINPLKFTYAAVQHAPFAKPHLHPAESVIPVLCQLFFTVTCILLKECRNSSVEFLTYRSHGCITELVRLRNDLLNDSEAFQVSRCQL